MLGFGKTKKRIENLEEENKILKKEISDLENDKWDLVDIIKKIYLCANDGLQKPAYSKESLKVKLREIRSETEPIHTRYKRFIDVIAEEAKK